MSGLGAPRWLSVRVGVNAALWCLAVVAGVLVFGGSVPWWVPVMAAGFGAVDVFAPPLVSSAAAGVLVGAWVAGVAGPNPAVVFAFGFAVVLYAWVVAALLKAVAARVGDHGSVVAAADAGLISVASEDGDE